MLKLNFRWKQKVLYVFSCTFGDYYTTLAVIIFCCTALFSRAQTNSQITVGGGSNDRAQLFKLQNGDYLALGKSNVNGNDDFLVVRLNSALNVLWSKTYGNSTNEEAYAMSELPSGNLLISGTRDNVEKTLLLEISAVGNLINARELGSADDRLIRLLNTLDGGIVNYGELEGLVPGYNKISVLKYGSSLNVEWKYYYSEGTAQFELHARSAQQLSDSTFIITAFYNDLLNNNNDQIRLLKITSNGIIKWVMGYHGNNADSPAFVNVTNDGGYLVCGNTHSYNATGGDVLIFKTDSLGNLVWAKTYGGSGFEDANQFIQLSDNDFAVIGSTNSFGFGNQDMFLLRIDSLGNLLSAKVFGGATDDIGSSIDTFGNQLLLSGYSGSFGYGGEDIYMVLADTGNTNVDSCSLSVTSQVTTANWPGNDSALTYTTGTFTDYFPSTAQVNTLSFNDSIICSCGTPMSLTFITSVVRPPLSNGAARIMVSGGAPPYLYSLDNLTFQTGNTFTSLALGNYQAYVTDSSGCAAQVPFTINEANCHCNH